MDEEIVKENPDTEKIRNEVTEGITSEAAPAVEEIDTAPKHATTAPAKSVAVHKREEPPPNPLLLDPYEWDKCTITVGYLLLPDQLVSLSVHNHKDEPIVKTSLASDVPLPAKISGVMAQLQSIWPTSPVNVTVVLLPRQDEAAERPMIASVRVSTDTPIIQEGVESNLPFPAPIVAMLDELKALMPERALKNIEKNAKEKAVTPVKPSGRSTVSKPATSPSGLAASKNVRKDQMSLF